MSEQKSEKIPVSIRLAQAEDTSQVMELTRTIWGGHDYVPYVWEEWLHDGQGPLVVAEAEGRVLGLAKLSRYSPENWWLHGLRTHPDLEGRGVATQIHNFLVDWWEQEGRGALRLTTHLKRLAVHHLCEKTGFTRLGEIYQVIAPAIHEPEQAHLWRPLPLAEAPSALQAIQASQVLDLCAGLMDIGWEWVSPHLTFIEDAVQRGMAWQHEASGSCLVGWQEENTDEESGQENVWLMLGAAACPLDDLESVLLDLRRLAGELGFTHGGWLAPRRPELEPILKRGGYASRWDDSMYIYEKRSG